MNRTRILSALALVGFSTLCTLSALAEEPTQKKIPSASTLTAKERCSNVFQKYVTKFDQTEARLTEQLLREKRISSTDVTELGRLLAPATLTLNELYDQCNKPELDDEQAGVIESIFN